MLAELIKKLGHLWFLFKGPYTVNKLPVDAVKRLHTVCSEDLIDGYQVNICSELIEYKTNYSRWWIPDQCTTLYYVSGKLVKETCSGLIAKPLEPLVVSSSFFKRLCPCHNAHYNAINTYIDTVMLNLRKMSVISA